MLEPRTPHAYQWIQGLAPVTRISLAWEAARATAIPPLGVLGNALNALAGHHLAEAATHRLLDELLEQLRREI